LNISNDKFIRTTNDDHKKAVQVSETMYIQICMAHTTYYIDYPKTILHIMARERVF
jgi:methionyl-tRNA synthetase